MLMGELGNRLFYGAKFILVNCSKWNHFLVREFIIDLHTENKLIALLEYDCSLVNDSCYASQCVVYTYNYNK